MLLEGTEWDDYLCVISSIIVLICICLYFYYNR